jgi:hypothetical protein
MMPPLRHRIGELSSGACGSNTEIDVLVVGMDVLVGPDPQEVYRGSCGPEGRIRPANSPSMSAGQRRCPRDKRRRHLSDIKNARRLQSAMQLALGPIDDYLLCVRVRRPQSAGGNLCLQHLTDGLLGRSVPGPTDQKWHSSNLT